MQPATLPTKQTGNGVRIRATVLRRAPVLDALNLPRAYAAQRPCPPLTQTDLAIVKRVHPIG